MVDVLEIAATGVSVVSYLIYAAIIIQFFNQPSNEKRVHFVAVVAGVLALLFLSSGSFTVFFYNPAWPFMVTQMLIMTFLALAGIELLIDQKTAAILLVVFTFAFFNHQVFWAMLVGVLAYIIVSYKFILSTLHILGNWGSRLSAS